MYFRGPVLTRFDGIEWTPLGLPFAPASLPSRPPTLETRGTPLGYEVTLEPLRLASVPLLEATTEVGADRRLPRGRARRPAVARRQADPRAPSLQGDRQHALRARRAAPLRRAPGKPRAAGRLQSAHDRLGARLSRRSVAPRRDADASWRRPSCSTSARSGFSYTLAPGDYGRDGIDEFWLDRKEGFCEHFAAAFVVVMRAAGVPARIVTGYQGTDLPAVDGYYVVRQSSAHAWAEFWQSGTGWVRADPTGAVAPDRIGRSNRLAPQPGFVAGTLDAMNPQLFARAAQRLGSGQQPLEPVGPQLLARPAARRPEADRLRRADLGRPRPPPRRHA